jgi:predicted nucleic acid-binding protein
MICLDNNLLSDYLAGEASAKEFLEPYADEVWCVSAVVQYEAMMGAFYGHIPGTISDVEAATAEFEKVAVTERTVREATALQEELSDHGIQLEARDALIAGSALEVGAALATEDGGLHDAGSTGLIDVLAYERS